MPYKLSPEACWIIVLGVIGSIIASIIMGIAKKIALALWEGVRRCSISISGFFRRHRNAKKTEIERDKLYKENKNLASEIRRLEGLLKECRQEMRILQKKHEEMINEWMSKPLNKWRSI